MTPPEPMTLVTRGGARRLLPASALTAIVAGHTLLETSRDALFLQKLAVSQLPWMYMLLAALAALVAALPWRRVRARAQLSIWLASGAAVTLAFAVLIDPASRWTLYALYVWTGTFGAFAISRLWSDVAALYTLADAKRDFGLVGSGSIVGAILGGALARALFEGHSPRVGLVVAAALFAGASALAFVIPRPAPPISTSAPSRETVQRALLDDPYLRAIGLVGLAGAASVTLLDYHFKATVVRSVAPDRLATTLASVSLVGNAASAVLQVLSLRAVRALGVTGTIQVLPALLSIGGVALAAGASGMVALGLRALDITLRFSIHRTGMELLFVPIADADRQSAKPVLDVTAQRAGQTVASALILGAVALALPAAAIAWLLALASAAWAWTAWRIRPAYLDNFRATLRHGAPASRAAVHPLDLAALEVLVTALGSPHEDEVLAAIAHLVAHGKGALVPSLLVHHPSKRIVLRALEHFSSEPRADLEPVLERLLAHADPEIRAAALRACWAARPAPARIDAGLADSSPTVRATAAVLGAGASPAASEVFDETVRAGDTDARVALLRALQQAPSPRLSDALTSLASCGEPVVMREAAAAIARLRSASFLDLLVPMLRDRRLRETARQAILAAGPEALARLDALLGSRATPASVLRHLPRTVSRFPARDAAPVLMRHLHAHPDGVVRYRCLRGLGRLRENHPTLQLDRASIHSAAARAAGTATKVRGWRLRLASLEPPDSAAELPVDELLAALLEDKEAHAVERAFRLLKLARPAERWDYVHAGLRSADPRLRSASRELLEELLPRPLRGLLALTDEAVPDEHALPGTGEHRESRALRAALLAEILDSGGETERALAAHYAALAGLDGARAAAAVSRPGEPAPSARALAILADAPSSGPRPELDSRSARGGGR